MGLGLHFLATTNSNLPTVNDVITAQSSGNLESVETQAVGVANSGLSIVFQVGIILLMIAAFVAILYLAFSGAHNRGEGKTKLIVIVLCVVLFFSVVSFFGFAQTIGNSMFNTSTSEAENTQTQNVLHR